MTAGPLRSLGFWAPKGERGPLPNPADLVDPGWDESERGFVAAYLERGQIAGHWMGSSRCRLCGRVNGWRDYSDGHYIWPEGLTHYVVDHAVRLPAEFVAHVGRRTEHLEESERDHVWWLENAHRTRAPEERTESGTGGAAETAAGAGAGAGSDPDGATIR